MKVLVEEYLENEGYEKIRTNVSEVSLLFRTNANSTEVISLLEDRLELDLTPIQYSHIKRQAERYFLEKGYSNIHIMTIVLADDFQKTQDLSQNDRFCWMIERNTKKLILFENQVDDFYGLREKLENFLEKVGDGSEKNKQKQVNINDNTKKNLLEISSFKQYITVTNIIILINVIVFVVCTFTGDLLYNIGAINWERLYTYQEYYRLITSIFLHADAEHILGNMLILFMAAKFIEKILGPIRFLILYFLTGMLGSIFSLIMQNINLEFYTSIGASGAVFGILGALLFFVVIKHKEVEIVTVPRLLFYLLYSIYIGFRATNIDNFAHIGGLLSGTILAFVLWLTIRNKEGKRENED